MREWTEQEVTMVNDLIAEERRNYGRPLPAGEWLPAGWCAVLEAERNYRKMAGCYTRAEYRRRCIREAFDEIRNSRNERIQLESEWSLDQRFDGSNETAGQRYFATVGDGLKTVDLWDYVRRQGALKRKITYLRYCGYIDSEIVERLRIDPKMYRSLLREIKEALVEWQAS